MLFLYILLDDEERPMFVNNYILADNNNESAFNHCLSIGDVANHYRLQPSTVRKWVREGRLEAVKLAREYRLSWPDVWACENGLIPRGIDLQKRYQMPMITKMNVSAGVNISVRSVDRWIYSGMPTRNIFGNVRMNPRDVQDWLKLEFGLLAPLYPYLMDEGL